MAARTMLFKIGKPAKTFAAINYNSNKADKKMTAKLTHSENFGYLQDQNKISKEEFENYLRKYSERNNNIKKPQFHGILSSKGRIHSYEELKQSALEIMYKLGYEGNPILIYEHHDTDNNHVHIVSSRVDIYGKKIKDSHEKRRAMAILNDMLAIKPDQEWEIDLGMASSYHVTNLSQFLLLLELKGYKVQKTDRDYHFYKYGKSQGKLAEATISELIFKEDNRQTAIAELQSMRAIIKKYQYRYGGELVRKDDLVNTTDKNNFRSNLTEFLSKTFGWQFVFFVAKGKKEPYGYAIIDHKNKLVHKGSDVMKLHELVQTKTCVDINTDFSSSKMTHKGVTIIIKSTHVKEKDNPHFAENFEPSVQATRESSILATLVDDQLWRLDADSKETGRRRKKRKRKI